MDGRRANSGRQHLATPSGIKLDARMRGKMKRRRGRGKFSLTSQHGVAYQAGLVSQTLAGNSSE